MVCEREREGVSGGERNRKRRNGRPGIMGRREETQPMRKKISGVPATSPLSPCRRPRPRATDVLVLRLDAHSRTAHWLPPLPSAAAPGTWQHEVMLLTLRNDRHASFTLSQPLPSAHPCWSEPAPPCPTAPAPVPAASTNSWRSNASSTATSS